LGARCRIWSRVTVTGMAILVRLEKRPEASVA
jgi:hypothetical protein